MAYGDNLAECGFCGKAHIANYVCTCGWDKGYAEERDEDGNLIEVWFKRIEEE